MVSYKKLRFAILIAATLSVASVTSVQAAPGWPGQSLWQGVKQRFQRMYLMLPGTKSGKAVVEQSAMAMGSLKSAEFSFQLKGDVVGKNDQNLLSSTITLAGPTEMKDTYDPKTLKQDMNMAGEFTMQGTTLKANADFKVDGHTIYMKLNELPALPFFDPSQFKDQWYKFDSNSMPSSAVTKSEVKDLTAEQKQTLKQAYVELLAASRYTPAKGDTLNGRRVFVVEVTMPDEALTKYINTVMEVGAATAEASSEEQVAARAQMTESLPKVLTALDEFKVVMYIDRNSFYMRKLELPMSVNVQELQKLSKSMATSEEEDLAAMLNQDDSKKPTGGEDEDTDSGAASPAKKTATKTDVAKKTTGKPAVTPPKSAATPFGDLNDIKTIKFTIVSEFDKFNQPVTFELPSDAKDFQTIMQQYLQNAMGQGAMMGGKAGSLDAAGAVKKVPRPTELPDLSAEEEAMLKEYGIKLEDL